jgi:hypothetical protein
MVPTSGSSIWIKPLIGLAIRVRMESDGSVIIHHAAEQPNFAFPIAAMCQPKAVGSPRNCAFR